VGPAGNEGGSRIPSDLKDTGGDGKLPSVLQETAVAFFPSKTDGKGMKLVLQDTGADGLRRTVETWTICVAIVV
jgi:hypothetical protein